MKVSFEGIGENLVTFYNSASAPAAAGHTVKMSANGEVAACADGDVFCGVCSSCSDELAAVKTCGCIGMAYTGTAPTLGYAKLASDANGGVKVSASGREYLVVEVDTVNKTVEFAL